MNTDKDTEQVVQETDPVLAEAFADADVQGMVVDYIIQRRATEGIQLPDDVAPPDIAARRGRRAADLDRDMLAIEDRQQCDGLRLPLDVLDPYWQAVRARRLAAKKQIPPQDEKG